MWPSSWNARIRWSGIARPMWMSGEVTSIPSFTRSGRPSSSFASSPPSGRTSTAFRVRSARPIGATLPGALALLRRKESRRRSGGASASSDCSRSSCVLARARAGGVHLRAADARSRRRSPSSTRRQQHTAGEHLRLRRRRAHGARDPARLAGAGRRPLERHLAVAEARDRRDRGQALLRAPRRRRARHRARALWADITGAAPCRAARRSRSSSSRTRSTATRRRSTRKLKEAALAWQLEQIWTKDQILTAYLNTIYFGNGAYGVQEACKIYFGHSAADVKPAEAALLAGIPEDPSLYDPVAHPNGARSAAEPRAAPDVPAALHRPSSQYASSLASRCRTPQDVRLPVDAERPRRRTSRTTCRPAREAATGRGRSTAAG